MPGLLDPALYGPAQHMQPSAQGAPMDIRPQAQNAQPQWPNMQQAIGGLFGSDMLPFYAGLAFGGTRADQGRLATGALTNRNALAQDQRQFDATQDFRERQLGSNEAFRDRQQSALERYRQSMLEVERKRLAASMQPKQPKLIQELDGVRRAVETGRLTPQQGEQRIQSLVNKGAGINIDLGQGMNLKGLELPKFLREDREAAVGAAQTLSVVGRARQLIDDGIRTGSMAETRQTVARAAQLFGIPVDQDTLANTDEYIAIMAQQTAQVIQQFGAGTGLSDADREYARRAAGGDIRMDVRALMRLLDIAERGANNTMQRYQRTIAPIIASDEGKVMEGYLTVNPADYTNLPSTEQAGPQSDEAMRRRFQRWGVE